MAKKIWDQDTCTCSCPSNTWTHCSTGFEFDFQDSCTCVRTTFFLGETCNSFLSIVVAVFVCFLIFILAIVSYYKRKYEAMIRSNKIYQN